MEDDIQIRMRNKDTVLLYAEGMWFSIERDGEDAEIRLESGNVSLSNAIGAFKFRDLGKRNPLDIVLQHQEKIFKEFDAEQIIRKIAE